MAFSGINGFGFGFGFPGMGTPGLGSRNLGQTTFGAQGPSLQNTPTQMYQLTQVLQMLMGALQQLQNGYQQMMGQPNAQPAGFGHPIQGANTGGAGRAGGGTIGAGGGAGNAGTGAVPGVSDPGFAAWAADPKNTGSAERARLSQLSDDQRAALHVWGMQTGSSGKNDGGVYFNILNNPQDFKPAEVALAQRLYSQEMQQYGGVTGKALDGEFFKLYKGMTGQDISQRYANRPIEFATGPVNMQNRTTGNNGLGEFDNAVIRLWGHDRLDNGANDGSIVQFTLNSGKSMDSDLVGKQRGNIEALLAADEADGGRDGSALARAFGDSLDRIYLGGPGANVDKTLAESGINRTTVGSVLDKIKNTPFPGIPPGIDITNMQNIGKCPFFKGAMGQVSINQ